MNSILYIWGAQLLHVIYYMIYSWFFSRNTNYIVFCCAYIIIYDRLLNATLLSIMREAVAGYLHHIKFVVSQLVNG